jgi:heptosyltransferase-3
MNVPLIPSDLLKKSDKILFIAHLALGDYTYLQNCFQAFARAYPHLKLHLWVDEVRRTSDASQWPHLKKNVLYDWLDACDFIEKVYKQNYSPELFQASDQGSATGTLSDRRLAGHPASRTSTPTSRARSARTASCRPQEAERPAGPAPLVQLPQAGREPRPGRGRPHERAAHQRRARGMVPPAGRRRDPAVRAHSRSCTSPNASSTARRPACTSGASTAARASWSSSTLRQDPQALLAGRARGRADHHHARPAGMARRLLHRQRGAAGSGQREGHAGRRQLDRTELFSANENFFQLPAMLAQCDLIVSVETAVMHLANAVGVPVVALMRQKTPEWAPVDKANSTVITADQRRDWVKAIPVHAVMHALA